MSSANIVLLITGLAIGGAETQLVRTVKELRTRGHTPCVVTLVRPEAYMDELSHAGVAVFSLDVKSKLPDPRTAVRLVRLIRILQPSIVHSYMFHANLLARMVRPFTRTRLLVSSARSTNEGGRFRMLLYRLTDRLCDITTQVSREGVDRYVQVRAVPEHRIRYVPNGVDTDQFRPDQAARARAREEMRADDRFVWLAVGRLAPPKDYPCMLQAFARVVRIQPHTRLLIAGQGSLRSELEATVHSLGLESHVSLLGLRRDVQDLLNAADGFVNSSAWEGMANVLLEAASSGLPIVATDVGATPDIVADGTGLVVPPRNAPALAEAMLRVMAMSTDERQRLGSRARLHVKTHFSLDAVVDQWEALYRELAKKKGLVL